MRCACAAWCLVFCLLTLSAPAADGSLEYNRDIRPILAENCFSCHGPDSASRKADLRLDRRDDAITAKAFVPGKVDDGSLLERIFTDDAETIMPPPASHKKLTAAQKELLKQWIAQGAVYQPHWSLIPAAKPASPVLKSREWIRNPIDEHVLALLESSGLNPAAEADRYTLARRLSLDIRGVPPSPAEVSAYVNDASPNAWEKLIDTFLQSPQWGEHRARYWLDAARYADTHGIHFDNQRDMWTYRDWVIGAYNRNLPFDQFTVEQLAGDLLPDATLDQKVASGFNRCNITTNEGGIIDEEYLVLYTRDRTETVSQVWMGTTANCAVCHSHKFDDLSHQEFYELAAFFNNTTQGARDGNIKDTPPILTVVRDEERAKLEQLSADLTAARKSLEERKKAARAEHDLWAARADSTLLSAAIPGDHLHFFAGCDDGQGNKLKARLNEQEREVELAASVSWQDGPAGDKALQTQGSAFALPEAGDFEKDESFSISAWIKIPGNDGSGAVVSRMDTPEKNYRGWDVWVQGRRVGMHVISSWADDGLKVVSKKQLAGDKWTHIAVSYDGSAKASGVKVYIDGKLEPVNVENDKLKSSIRTSVPFRLGERTGGSPLAGLNIQELRVYRKLLQPGEVESLAKSSKYAAILAKPVDQRKPREKDELFTWWLQTSDEKFKETTVQISRLEAEVNQLKASGAVAHVMQEKPGEAMAYILHRGEYDQRRDPVKPDTPDALPPFPADLPRNRLGFARWLLRPEHPLTARVNVNRMWQEVFGQGIVRTAGDFGVAGELPINQPLLDFLAVDFREHNWDVKRFYKQIFLSATYRQAAVHTPEKLAKDPANRLLSRGPRFRMDAEMIRDYALSCTGILVPKIGGPSVKPYQPDGVWEAVAMIGSNTRDYRRDAGENLYRRSMYTFWKRSAPPANMEIFNAPNRETCVMRRDRTNTPLQALVTLNDVQFVEAARHLAQRVLKEGGSTDDDRLAYLGMRIVCRPWKPEELDILRQSLTGLTAHYAGHEDDAKKLITSGESPPDATLAIPQLAAWTMLANEILNLDEVLNK